MKQMDDITSDDLRLLTADRYVILPTHTIIKVIVTSEDVIHSWAVPSFGVKVDAVPGKMNLIWLDIYRPGHFFGQCSELCGMNHAFMPINVVVVNKEDFLLALAWEHKKYNTFDDIMLKKKNKNLWESCMM